MRPRAFFRHAEAFAVRMRKLLRRRRLMTVGRTQPASKDDVERRIALIEVLARHGRRLSAEDTMAVAELIEIQIDQLGEDAHDMLAS